MKTIAFFNNKGEVGKTTLAFHLAHMLPRVGVPTLAVDLDPQANLTSAFFDEERVEELWQDGGETILGCVEPIIEELGDVRPARPIAVADDLHVVAGHLGLSRFEDKLSDAWLRCFGNDPAALRATTAFHRVIQKAAAACGAELALLDVGPNLGAINRAALLAADFLVVPLAADLFSLQGLRNLGPTARTWRQQWGTVRSLAKTTIEMPAGTMQPAGYVVLQHAVRLDRPAAHFARWAARVPEVFRTEVLAMKAAHVGEPDPWCLATLRNYRSLMPMAQESRKPMFDLKAADGAVGSFGDLMRSCRQDFEDLARRVSALAAARKASP